MITTRFIPRLDIKSGNLIKGINLEGLRVVGNPVEYARRYAEDADELLYMDCVASLYSRDSLLDIIAKVSDDIFIPMTVGGGIRGIDDVRAALLAGADKVAISTSAVAYPPLITVLAQKFGSQCIVLSIEHLDGYVFTNNGREATGLRVNEWACQGVELGAGEILLTSIAQEGTNRGYDVAQIAAVASRVRVPVIASGGMGAVRHVVDAVAAGASAIAMADVLHYNKMTLQDIKMQCATHGMKVRPHECTQINPLGTTMASL